MPDELTLAEFHRLVPAAEEEDLLEQVRDEAHQREVQKFWTRILGEDASEDAGPETTPEQCPGRSASEALHDALHLLAAELDARLVPEE